jgi:cystathionine beta-lyase
MIYDFDEVIDRRKSESTKWYRYGPDVLPLWVADMDFICPEPVLRALQERVAHGVFGYPEVMPSLIEIIIQRLMRLYDWQVKPEDLVFMPGVVQGFHLGCHAFVNQDEAVLVQTPVYPPILRASKTTCILHQEMALNLNADGSYGLDIDLFERSFTDQTRLFILCNPHNPVGKVYCQDDLERIAAVCLRHQVIICSDEIHAELLFSGQRHIPIAALDPEIAQHTITLIAPSKTFNIPGLDCSLAVIQNPELRKKYLAARKGLMGGVNVLGLTAALAAYQYGDDWLQQVLHYMENNRDYLYEFVKNALEGVHMAKPEGTYLAWLDCREAGDRVSANPHKFFLEYARVALNDGLDFGLTGAGFVRLNFACPRQALTSALSAMRDALNLT